MRIADRDLALCIALLIVFVIAGCSTPKVTLPLPTLTPLHLQPKVINHPPPDMVANAKGIGDMGCARDERELWSTQHYWTCTSDSRLVELGCERPEADDWLGGFTPSYPMVRCLGRSEPPDKASFRQIGCLRTEYMSYAVLKDSQFHLVIKESELRALFAPVESANEALSYALVVTDLAAYYGIELDSLNRYLVDEIEDTHVDEVEDGYLVHLYSRPECGCKVHTIYAMDFLVTRDGSVETAKSQPVYEFQICVD